MTELFSYGEFIPRYFCGEWTPFLLGAYWIANFTIFAAYMAIPLELWWLSKSRVGWHWQPQTWWINLGFGLFIFFCGVGHLLDGCGSFHYPAYRLFTLWHVLTGGLSIWVAVYFPIVLLRSSHANN